MAHDLAHKLATQQKSFVVLDFSAPDKRALPLGAYLADEFSAALAQSDPSLKVIDRKRLPVALKLLLLKPEREFDSEAASELAVELDANCVISGSYGNFQGELGVTVVVNYAKNCPSVLVNAKLTLSPEMATQLAVPLESLEPAGGAAKSGEAGITNVKCLKCPQARYSDAAVKAKQQGTVTLVVLISPEGRATDVKVLKGLGYGLSEQAVAAVKKWIFAPAVDPDGVAVAVTQDIQVTFSLYY
jgi:TonB family protein